MFGEDIITGEREISIDNKRRIVIPKFTGIEENDRLICIYENDNTFFEIINFNDFKKVIKYKNSLSKKFLEDGDFEKYNIINQEMKKIIEEAFVSSRVDKWSRFVLDSNIVEKFDLNNKILVKGSLTSDNIYSLRCNKI